MIRSSLNAAKTKRRIRRILEKALPLARPLSKNWSAEYKKKKVKL